MRGQILPVSCQLELRNIILKITEVPDEEVMYLEALCLELPKYRFEKI